jgi:hypothetical protein
MDDTLFGFLPKMKLSSNGHRYIDTGVQCKDFSVSGEVAGMMITELSNIINSNRSYRKKIEKLYRVDNKNLGIIANGEDKCLIFMVTQ